MSRPWANLVDLNESTIRWFSERLGITCRYHRASRLPIHQGRSERLLELCLTLGANKYVSGVNGKHYLNVDIFEARDIAVVFQEYVHPTYQQMHGADFVSCLSILDLLFNAGDRALTILASGHREVTSSGVSLETDRLQIIGPPIPQRT